MLKLYIGLAVAGVVFAVKNSNYWSFKQNIVKAMEDQESQGNNLQSDSSKINLEAPPNSDVKSKVGSIENSSAKAQKDKDFFSEKLVAPNSHFTKLEEKDLVLRENLPKINGKGKDIDFSTKFAIEKVNKLLPENVLPLKIQRKVPIMVGEFSKFRLNLLKPILTNPPVLLLIELSDHLRKIASVEYLEVVRKYISDYNKFKGSGDLKLKDLYVATEKVMHELELICYKFDRLASKLFKVYGEFVAFYDNLSKTCGGSEFGYAIKHFKEAVYFRNEVNKEKESYRNKVKSFWNDIYEKFMKYLYGWGLTLQNIKKHIYEKLEKPNGKLSMSTYENKIIEKAKRPLFTYKDLDSKSEKTATEISYEYVSFICDEIKDECKRIVKDRGSSLSKYQVSLLSFLSEYYIEKIRCLEGVSYDSLKNFGGFSELSGYKLLYEDALNSLKKGDSNLTEDDSKNITDWASRVNYFYNKFEEDLPINSVMLGDFAKIFDKNFMEKIGVIEKYRHVLGSYFRNKASEANEMNKLNNNNNNDNNNNNNNGGVTKRNRRPFVFYRVVGSNNGDSCTYKKIFLDYYEIFHKEQKRIDDEERFFGTSNNTWYIKSWDFGPEDVVMYNDVKEFHDKFVELYYNAGDISKKIYNSLKFSNDKEDKINKIKALIEKYCADVIVALSLEKNNLDEKEVEIIKKSSFPELKFSVNSFLEKYNSMLGAGILSKTKHSYADKYMITELINEANCLIHDNERCLDSNELIWLYRELLNFKDTFVGCTKEKLLNDCVESITKIGKYIHTLLNVITAVKNLVRYMHDFDESGRMALVGFTPSSNMKA